MMTLFPGNEPICPHAPPLNLTLLWLSFAAWSAMELWVFGRDLRRVGGVRADRGSFWLIVAVIYISVACAYYAFFDIPQGRIRASRPLVSLVGVGLMWAGMGLRFWAIRTLGSYFHTSVIVQDAQCLIRGGPYRRLRNPAYAGSLMTLIGLGLGLGNWISLAVLAGLPLLAYAWRIKVEEAALSRQFGDNYRDYASRTWRLVPFLW
jgi:protein-S-isoprenylcysteine O-methyltransferase